MRRTLNKAITLLLTLALLLSISVPALAAGEQFDFTLTANGERETTIALGARAKIALTVQNNSINDGAVYDLYTLQDYICYDRSFFDIDESSISVKKISGGDLFTATAVCFDGGDPDRVYVHRSATTGQSVEKSIEVVTFDLIAKKVGTSHITHDTIEMTSAGLQRLSYAAGDATVIVGERSNRITATAGAGGTISPSGDVDVVEGEDQTFTITPGSGYKIKDVKVDNLSQGAVTSYTFTNVREPHAISAAFESTGGGGGGGGGGTPPVEGEAAPVIVDDVVYEIGTVVVEEDVTTVVVDHEALDAQIESASEHVRVPITAETGAAAAQFVVYDVEKMAAKKMTLVVDLDEVDYIIPAIAVDTAALDAAFPGVSTADIPFTVTVSDTPEARNNEVGRAVTESGGSIVLPAMDFTVTATYGGKSVEVEVFEKYTARVVEITAEQSRRVTTAVVYEPDGSLRHVPTEVYQQGGKWYARVNSLTNSTYALIFKEASFADANGKWFEAVVTEMASRKIINGRDESTFDGEAPITRAEFAAIMVRALGLPERGDASAFTDVARSAWYYGAVGKAYEYGLIEGRGNGVFDPQANITRQEAMAMVHRAAAITEFAGSTGTLAAFPDADSVSGWALSDAQWNVGSGLIQGSNGLICGQDNITRGETATIILRLLQRSGLVDVRTEA